MRQLNFAAPYHATTVRREIKRMFHLHSQELSRAQMRILLEQAMHEVVTEQVQADPYERAPGRTDRRNGSYPRRFLTLCGLVDLKVPRARGSESPFKVVIKAYRQREERLDELIRLIFFNGISTRDVGSVIKALTGHPVSASTVSTVTAKMEAQVRAFHSRRIEDHYVYLILDGVRVRFRTFKGAVHRLVLCAVGVKADGRKEFIDFLITRSESETTGRVS
jgi:putative transposase